MLVPYLLIYGMVFPAFAAFEGAFLWLWCLSESMSHFAVFYCVFLFVLLIDHDFSIVISMKDHCQGNSVVP